MKSDMPFPPDQSQRDLAVGIANSCIVQAPAGSGKTTLLASRYVNLLAQVERPEEILAITFTKKAAGEMRQRVMSMLAEDSPAARRVRARNQTFGWQMFENPNVLKIQTIDSFALEIASQSPGLDNAAGLRITLHGAQYYEQAATDLLRHLYVDHPTNAIIGEFLAFLDNDANKAVQLLSAMLAKRDQWLGPVTHVATRVEPSLTLNLLSAAISQLREDAFDEMDRLLNAEDQEMMAQLAELSGEPPHGSQVLNLLLTKTNTLRKNAPVLTPPLDSKQKRHFKQWLLSLHERELEEVLVACARLPAQPSRDGTDHSPEALLQTQNLHLCCIALALAASELDRLLEAAGTLDFTGLMLRAQSALEDAQGPTELALYLDYRIRHLLIDEFQDTSRAQFAFFNLLTAGWQPNDGNTFFAVGDPMQSVYRFRDADVSIFTDAQVTGLDNVPLRALTLTANFRSDPAVVHWCNAFFSPLFGGARANYLGHVSFSAATPMVAPSDGLRVNCLRFNQHEAETDHLVQAIKSRLAVDDNSSIAVLCSARTQATKLLECLADLNIPVQATDMELLSHRPVIQDLMGIYQVVLNPNEPLGLFTLLRSPLIGLTLVQLTALTEYQDYEAGLQELALQSPAVARFNQARHWAASLIYEVSPREVIEGVWFRCGGTEAYPESEWRHASAWFKLLDQLDHEAYDIDVLRVALSSLYAETDAHARVQVMTIHKSKGLEFDHVFLPYLDRRRRNDNAPLLLWRLAKRGLLMGVQGSDVHDWLKYEDQERARNEEKRLLYVACTRAKRSLNISFFCEDEKKPGGLARWLETQAEPAKAVAIPTVMPQASSVQPIPENRGAPKSLTRLPVEYRWQPPGYQALPRTDHRTVQTQRAAGDTLGARFEVAQGLLLHQVFVWIAEQFEQTFSMPLSQVELNEFAREKFLRRLQKKIEIWAPHYAQDNFSSDVLCQEALSQIRTTLAHDTGLWVLSPHAQARSEWPLSGLYNNTLTQVVLDRSFVADGRRWIIDFKTSTPGEQDSKADFIRQEVARYTPQLHKYRAICLGIDPAPAVTALYFSAIGELVVVHD